MNNGDRIRQCTNEELLVVIFNYNKWAIYSGGDNNRLLDKDNPDDLLLWLNKTSDQIDIDTIFNFNLED